MEKSTTLSTSRLQREDKLRNERYNPFSVEFMWTILFLCTCSYCGIGGGTINFISNYLPLCHRNQIKLEWQTVNEKIEIGSHHPRIFPSSDLFNKTIARVYAKPLLSRNEAMKYARGQISSVFVHRLIRRDIACASCRPNKLKFE